MWTDLNGRLNYKPLDNWHKMFIILSIFRGELSPKNEYFPQKSRVQLEDVH